LPPYINAAGEHQAENAAVYYRRPDQGIGCIVHWRKLTAIEESNTGRRIFDPVKLATHAHDFI